MALLKLNSRYHIILEQTHKMDHRIDFIFISRVARVDSFDVTPN